MFRGPTLDSTATAFLAGDETLLVDALATPEDGRALRENLQEQHGARVAAVVVTHFMDDHVGGVVAFPEARVFAHRLFGFTHGLGRSAASHFDGYRKPDVLVDASMELAGGTHRLRIFYNPGKTVCMLNVDVAASDLVIAGDNLIGRIVYLSNSVPDLVDAALQRLQAIGRRHVVAGHQGSFESNAIGSALVYLRALGEHVRAAYGKDADWRERVLDVALEDCLPLDVQATPFEQHWHGQNLLRIVERQLFRVAYN